MPFLADTGDDVNEKVGHHESRYATIETWHDIGADILRWPTSPPPSLQSIGS
jgi:hypothetical protein